MSLTLHLKEVFLLSVFFYSKNTFIRIWKSDSNSIFDNVSHKYKNIFNNNELLKKIFIKKIIINQEIYYKKNYINIYIIKKKNSNKLCLWKESNRVRGELEENGEWKENEG